MTDDLSSDLASLKIARGEEQPRRGWAKPAITILALLLVGIGGYVVLYPMLEAQLFKTEVSVTEISVVSPAEASIQLTSTGYVVPQRISKVASKVPGRVKQISVVQGQVVKAGDLLYELDPADDQALINAAKSRVAAAAAHAATGRAQAETSRAELAEATLRATREQTLVKAGISSSGNADDLLARVTSLEHAVTAADALAKASQAEVAASGAEVQTLETNFQNLRVVAPINGTVLNKPPEIGEFVGPQPAGISVDMGGVELADFASMVVETDVPEQRLSLVKVGGPTEIVLDAYPQTRYRGETQEITPQVNRSKATVMVKVKFIDATTGVLPDMSARVSFLTDKLGAEAMKAPPKIVVPASSIVQRGGAKVVFVVESDRVHSVPVELGPEFGHGFELASGPAAGTRVVSNPPATMADGQKIKEKD